MLRGKYLKADEIILIWKRARKLGCVHFNCNPASKIVEKGETILMCVTLLAVFLIKRCNSVVR